MKDLPRILIIDDDFGRNPNGYNKDRDDFSFRLGLKNITQNKTSDKIENPVAEAYFCQGQIEDSSFVYNDLHGTLRTIREGWVKWPRWALILLDLHFKTGRILKNKEIEGAEEDSDVRKYFGLKLLENLWKDSVLREIPIVILSSMRRDEIEDNFTERGVYDFIDKSELNKQELEEILLNYGLLKDENIVGNSLSLLKCLREARVKARLANDNILILGETGVGKELLAKYIHEHSGRKGEFVTFFTHGVPDTLIENSLFGHIKGSYSGADRDEVGAAELADGGTLFIDEFGDITGSIQHKLRRLLDKNTREVQRIGSHEVKTVNLQIIMATNNLDLLSSEDFHKDVLFRAKIGKPIILPPLRERKEDIPLLADFFKKNCEKTYNAEPREVSNDALEALMSYSWPGNIRELESVIEDAIRNYPGLKYLSKNHIHFSDEKEKEQFITSTHEEKFKEFRLLNAEYINDIDSLKQIINKFQFDVHNPNFWAGKLSDIENMYAHFIARYLRASLEATKRITPENPNGKILIHPAVKLMTGDSTISASKAADVIKKLLGFSSKYKDTISSDPILKQAYEIALRLRPKKQKSKKEQNQ